MKYATHSKLFLALSFALLIFVHPAQADNIDKIPSGPDDAVMDMPVLSASIDPDKMTDPIMRITPDKSELVKLDQKAASVIVGNPNHISVLLDTPDTLVVVPRKEGASSFTVVAQDGSIIMQRHVIVGATKEQYVRIRRSCSSNDRNCKPTSTYFCPDMCHEVTSNDQMPTNRR